MFRRGFLRLGRIGQLPVHLHWTLPIGLYVFGGFRLDPVAGLCVAGLVLLHELGHALAVKLAGATATSIELTGFGGVCRWEGGVGPIGRAGIAWGGVAVQLLVLAAGEACFRFSVPVDPRVLWVATLGNAGMIGVNLLPFSPLDGAEAWQLPFVLGQSLRARFSKFQDPVHTVSDDEAFAPTSAKAAQARALAAQLLDDAKKEDP